MMINLFRGDKRCQFGDTLVEGHRKCNAVAVRRVGEDINGRITTMRFCQEHFLAVMKFVGVESIKAARTDILSELLDDEEKGKTP